MNRRRFLALATMATPALLAACGAAAQNAPAATVALQPTIAPAAAPAQNVAAAKPVFIDFYAPW